MSQMVDEKPKEGTGQWAELMADLFDRLTGKREITYEKIDISRAVDAHGKFGQY